MRKARFGISFKSVSAIVFWLVLFSLIVINVGYVGFTDAIIQQCRAGAFRIADTASLDINADELEQIREAGNDSEGYRRLCDRLSQLRQTSGAEAIEVIRPDPTDFGEVTVLFSAADQAGGVRATPDGAYREKYRQLYEHETDRAALTVYDNETQPPRHYIDVMIPLTGSDGAVKGILSVRRSLDAIVLPRGAFVRNVFVGLLGIIIVMILGQGAFMRRVILRPIKQITNEATRFADENKPPVKRIGETVRNQDEIGLLADAIDNMEDQVDRYVKDITRITAERERIAAELSLAEDIQTAMLPHLFPPFPDRKEFDLYAVMDPAREVGGDFYDFFLVDDDHLCLVIADVSGKGVPAALFMTMSKTIIQNCGKLGKSPSEILAIANDILCADNQIEMFVTVWIGILEISTGQMVATNAGHEYPAIRRAGGAFELYTDKHSFVVGGMESVRYREYTLQIDPGDVLFVYTDGLPEATDGDNQQFGTDRMLEALNAAPDAAPEQLLKHVRGAVDAFVGDAEQFDDLTMLCLKYNASKEEY